ncbi:MAG: hypothetical protein AAGA80_12415 [Cyanobacteria bacterium P01_F01_bin.143]
MVKKIIIAVLILMVTFGITAIAALSLLFYFVDQHLEPWLWEEIAMDGYKLKIYSYVDILGEPSCNMYITQEKEIAPNKFITQDFPLEDKGFCNSYEYRIPAEDEIIIWGWYASDSEEKPQELHFKFNKNFDY